MNISAPDKSSDKADSREKRSSRFISFQFSFLNGILLFFALILFLCGELSSRSESQEQQTSSLSDSSSEPRDHVSLRKVRVGYFPFDGFHMYDKYGKQNGYGYDYLQELRNYTNWKYEYSDPKHEWPVMLAMLREGKVDLVPGVTKTKERETEFAFSHKPICQVSTLLTVKAGNTRFQNEDYTTWNDIRVGVLKNSTQNDKFRTFSKEKGFTYKEVSFDKLDDLLQALQDGNSIDAVVTSSLRAIKEDEWILAHFNKSFMYIAVRKNDQTLLNELDFGMEKLETFRPDFQKRLRRIYYSQESGGKIPFTPDESAFIEKMNNFGRVFSIIINPDRKPFSWVENGEYRGLLKDYADEVSRRSGLVFRFVPVQTREEYYEKRFSPDIDLVFDTLIGYKEAENNRIKLSLPYFFGSVSKLRDKTIGNTIKTISILDKGDLRYQVLERIPVDIKVRYCKSLSELINDVKSSKSDVAYLYTKSAEYAVYEDQTNRLLSEYVPSMETKFSIGVREDLDPLFLSILNHVISSLDDTFANKVRSKYAPQVSEHISFKMVVHEYFFLSVVLPFLILFAACLFLFFMLLGIARRRKELQITAIKWDVASQIARLHPFQMHILSRQIIGDPEQFAKYWPVKDGAAAQAREWICSEDVSKIEKAYNDFVNKRSEHLWISFQAKRDGVSRFLACYAVRDKSDPELMVGVIQDITELKEAELERDAVQKLWEKVVDNAPVMMFIKSKEDHYRYVQCNKNFAKFIGRTQEEVIGHDDAELFNRPQDAKAFRKRDCEIMKNRNPQRFQETVVNAKGEVRHIQTVKMPLEDRNGRWLLIGLCTDVTDLQNSRDEARRHEETFRLTIQSIGDGVMTTDKNGLIQLLNPVAEELLGIRCGEAKGKPHEEIFRIFNALDGKPIVSPLQLALAEGKIVELGNHTDLHSFDGNCYHIADCAGPIRNEDNEIVGAVLIFRNVTEEYSQREELRASIALWNIASEIMKMIPYRMHIPTRQIIGNVEKLNHFWPIKNGRAILPNDWVYSEDKDFVNEDYVDFTAGKKDSFLITFRAIQDGQIHYYRRYGIRDPKDRDIMIGIIQDVTREKEIEKDRNASHALWDQVMNTMPIMMFVKSAEDQFRYTQCNQNFADLVGRKKEDVIGHTDQDLFPRMEDQKNFCNRDNKIMEEGRAQEFYEEVQGANRIYHFQTVKMPFTDAKGNRLLIGLAIDISAFKKAEEERNATLRLLNSAFAAMPVILFIKAVDDDFRYIQCNENFCKLVNKTEKEVLGRTDEEIFPNHDDITSFHQFDLEAIRKGTPLEIIETLQGLDKKPLYFRAVKVSTVDTKGRPILIGMSINITEMVEQREKIQASQFQLEAGCLMSRSFTFELDKNGKIISTNGLYTEMVPHVNGKPLAPEEWIVPEDQKEASDKIQSFFDNRTTDVTFHFRSDWFGQRRYYKCILKAYDEKVYGVTSDVTELVESAENLKANALMWKQVMDELPVRFFVKDATNDCRYLMCNKANAEFLGLPEESIIGKRSEEIIKPSREFSDYLLAERQILVDRKVNHMRINFPDPNGIIQEMEKIEMLVRGAGNKDLLVGIAFDITEREQGMRLAEISARILSGAVRESDFRKVLDHIGSTTIDVLKCRRVIFAKCDSEGKLHYLQDTGVDSKYHFSHQSIALHEHFWNCYLDRFANNELVYFERMGDDPTMEPLFEKHPQYRNMALIGTPVSVKDKLHLLMIITFGEPHKFTDNDFRTLRAIGNCIMLAENRSEQNEALFIAQEEQAYRLAERTALNDCLSIFLASQYMDVPFKEILERIRKQLGASDCYVIHIDPVKKSQICLTEANLDKDHSFLKCGESVPFDPESPWFKELKQESLIGESDFSTGITCDRFNDLFNQKGRIRSHWVATVQINDKVWGTLEVVYDDKSEHSYNPKDVSFVQSAARVVSLILNREQHRNDLLVSLETQLNLTKCLRHMVSEEETPVAMQNLLDIIRKHTYADASFLCELKEDPNTNQCQGKLTMDSQSCEYNKDSIPFGINEEWYLQFKQDKELYIPDTSLIDVDKTLGNWGFILNQDLPVKSYYEIPIFCNGSLWGSIGILYKNTVVPISQNHNEFLRNGKKFFEILLARQEYIRKLNEAVTQAQTAEKAKSFFLASMSHEIRTPLNAVIGFTEMIKDTNISREMQKEYAENIAIAGNALLQLINDILDLSKLEANQMQILPERIDLVKFCQNIQRTFQYNATLKNIDLVFEIPDNLPALMIDQARMRQIFFNLVGNSIKFTPNGGLVKVILKFSQLTTSSGSLSIEFSDTGIGMPEEDQKNIFEPFVQLSKYRGTNAANNGTGLGLPIVRRLIDRMGGTLAVVSKEGEGTTFYILLPNIELGDASDLSVKDTDPPNTDSKNSQPIHVLVVDDVPMNIKIFTLLLKRIGVSYQTANSGQEALDLLKENTFDWVLTDLYMNGMSGEDLAKIIRKDPTLKKTRIAVVTAETDSNAFDKKLFDAILLKPVDKQLLHECLFGETK